MFLEAYKQIRTQIACCWSLRYYNAACCKIVWEHRMVQFENAVKIGKYNDECIWYDIYGSNQTDIERCWLFLMSSIMEKRTNMCQISMFKSERNIYESRF